MELSPRQRRALEDICDTFCPSGHGVPSARELDVADAVLAAVAANPRAAERKQFAALLSGWDSYAFGARGGGRPGRFSAMAPEQRERVLLSWGDSRLPQRRAAFQALRKGALLFYYMVPGRYGARNPAWDAIGYDGPLGPLAEAPPKALSPTPIGRDTSLQCDVVIVGSSIDDNQRVKEVSGAVRAFDVRTGARRWACTRRRARPSRRGLHCRR